MAYIEKIQEINLRVANIIKQQQLLKSQAQNWEQLYKEATDIQKKLIEQSTENAKQNDKLNTEIANLKISAIAWEQKHQQQNEKQNNLISENTGLKKQFETINNELKALRLKEEQQLTMHFGAEKEHEQLKAINEDLKEQLIASQNLNAELQAELQLSKITLVEEQALINAASNQKNTLEKELLQLKENYQIQLSELHSKNSQTDNQTEKLITENRKLQENITNLNTCIEEKQREISLFQDKLNEIEAQFALHPSVNDNELLTSRLEQLTAQIANLEFERDLMKKTHADAVLARPSNITEAANQNSGSNDGQIHFLYTELQASQAANSELQDQIHAYIEIISEQTKNNPIAHAELKNLAEQNKIVKLAQAIEGNTVTSNIELKQKLNEMIKEVDRCIAKLSN